MFKRYKDKVCFFGLNSRKVVLTMTILVFLLAACGKENPGKENSDKEDGITAQESVPLSTSAEETAQLPIPADVPAQVDTVGDDSDDGMVRYICRVGGSEHGQMVFFYENNVLKKMEYSLNIKGMPEEIEERKRLEDYRGAEMADQESCVVIEIDVEAGGIKYLKDTVPFLAGVDDWSWENVKKELEKNGYQILDSFDDAVSDAGKIAREYYDSTVFTVLDLYVKKAEKDKIVFGVHCSKGDVIVEPDRSITMEFLNGEWVKTNEGY